MDFLKGITVSIGGGKGYQCTTCKSYTRSKKSPTECSHMNPLYDYHDIRTHVTECSSMTDQEIGWWLDVNNGIWGFEPLEFVKCTGTEFKPGICPETVLDTYDPEWIKVLNELC